MILCGFKPSSVASCLTTIGGLIRMTFCAAVSSSAGGSAVASVTVFVSATVVASIVGDSGGAAFASGAGFGGEGVCGFAAGATASFNFCFGSFVLAAAAGFRAAVVPRAAGLRVAVLLLVFVAIVLCLKFCSWPELP